MEVNCQMTLSWIDILFIRTKQRNVVSGDQSEKCGGPNREMWGVGNGEMWRTKQRIHAKKAYYCKPYNNENF